MRIPLTAGAYSAQSVIANAQRAVNLYPEINPQDTTPPVPVTHYLTPGLVPLATAATLGWRGLYRATDGVLYGCVGQDIVKVDLLWAITVLGSIASATGQVYMADNGSAVLIIDGTSAGYCIDMATGSFLAVNPTNFYGADRIDFLDGFFILNRPGTRQFYISLSNVTFANLTGGDVLTGVITSGGAGYVDGAYTSVSLTGGSGADAKADITVAGGAVTACAIVAGQGGENYRVNDVLSADASSLGGSGAGFTFVVQTIGSSAFDALDFVSKNSYADNIVGLIVMKREIWVLGALKTSIYYNAGAADFPFQQMPGVFVEHGCIAKNSIAQADLSIFWLSQDLQGKAFVLEGVGYEAKRISTHAIEQEIQQYADLSDAVGYTYQQNGHVFYVLTFRTANKTWVYDKASKQWHERTWTDENGAENAHRSNCGAFAYGSNVVGDWQNGKLYQFSTTAYTDFGGPIVRRRGFPHMMADAKRVIYRRFIADMQVGSVTGGGPADAPLVYVRWSDTRGESWGNPVAMSAGSSGDYLRSMLVTKLGMARDRVFEIFWSGDFETALNGAFVDPMPLGS